ncbi:MAG: hypothetical protein Q8L55_00185 [Phycisphaerales bacterium]|nr:hypothetical protein [Phycisphaerales bacterium]
MRTTPMMVMTAAACLAGSLALAQPADQPAGGIGFNTSAAREKANRKIEPPTLNLKSEESAAWPMIATVLFAGACLLASIIPPKRGHQD